MATQTRVRLIDIARAAGVSPTAVGRVLTGGGGHHVRVSESVRRRIERIAKEMDFHPNFAAQQLAGSSSKMISLIVDSRVMPLDSQRMVSLEKEASRRGYRMMIGQVSEGSSEMEEYLRDFHARGVEGLIIACQPRSPEAAVIRRKLSDDSPVVFLEWSLSENMCCVHLDYGGAVRQLVAHLADRGRRRIGLAYLDVPSDFERQYHSNYAEELTVRGLPVDVSMIWAGLTVEQRLTSNVEIVNRIVEDLIVQKGADALIVPNDLLAAGIITNLKRRGYRVPQDVAVAGMVNMPIGELFDPAITTINQHFDTYARETIKLLSVLIRNDTVPNSRRVVTIPVDLVVREST